MGRCFDLARLGEGYVSPNPMVGAVLVCQDEILGEGYHTKFGASHAEVEAVRSVPEDKQHLIPKATLYVSLEPCCVYGKTPPCTNLILDHGIMDVRISTHDPNPEVAGKSLALLKNAGVHVTSGIREEEGKALIRSFRTNILHQRPHVILKWAQSKYGITGVPGQQVWLSDPVTKTWSHGQRAKVDAILAGARTVETDNPSLTTRDFPGRSPHRVVLDLHGRLHADYHVFHDDGCEVFYFSASQNPQLDASHIHQFEVSEGPGMMDRVLAILFQHRIGSLLVEGGSFTHQLFIDSNLWDEAWVIRTQHPLDKGISAPLVNGKLIERFQSGSDEVVGIFAFKNIF